MGRARDPLAINGGGVRRYETEAESSVWYYLSTYNGAEAVDAVAEFALDESYPFRSQAIQGLGEFGELWRWLQTHRLTWMLIQRWYLHFTDSYTALTDEVFRTIRLIKFKMTGFAGIDTND